MENDYESWDTESLIKKLEQLMDSRPTNGWDDAYQFDQREAIEEELEKRGVVLQLRF